MPDVQKIPLVVFTMFILAGCVRCGSKPDSLFTRLKGEETGIGFVNRNTETEELNIFVYEYFYNGGGVAAGDINNDGLADLYFSSNSGENKLYLNEGDFHFRDITEISLTATPIGWKTGVSMVDINADGWLDIFVCRSGPGEAHERTNLVYVNNRDLTFTEMSWKVGLRDPSYTTQTAFFDYDRDGDLDAFVLNHSLLHISNSFDISQRNTTERYPMVGNSLFRNDGDRFVDVSDSLGVFGPASNYGLGISLSDVNNDGWVDVYTGCDYSGKDRLLINKKGRSFTDATDSLLTQISKFSMGTDIADINNDGWMDIFSLDMLPEDNYRQKQLMGADRYDQYMAMARNGLHYQSMRNMLHLNNGNGKFSEIAQLSGVSNTDWSWSSLFADFDNDGFQDLFITNGFKRDLTNNDFSKFNAFEEVMAAKKRGKDVRVLDVIAKLPENRISNYMFRGNATLTFENATGQWGLDEPSLSNGAVYADLDNDGDLDIVINNVNGEAAVYRNNAASLAAKNNFLRVRLKGDGGNTFAVGARVTVYASEKTWVREQLPVRGFQSSVDPVLHFGLGSVSGIDSVEVTWPDGSVQRVREAPINTLLEIEFEKRSGIAAEKNQDPLFSNVDPPFTFTHKENDFVDFRVQSLLPRLYSREGPAFASADVNGDQVLDYFLGGAMGQAARLFVSRPGGKFVQSGEQLFEKDKRSEDVDALFADVDGDGDFDLYVVSGGYEFTAGAQELQDRLYINLGKGRFERRELPSVNVSGSCVRAADFDHDGDLDLFVAGKVVPGRFPESPESTLLVNDGKGNFTIDQKWASQYGKAGLIADALWLDIDQDTYPELILAGEWMPLKIFRNVNGHLADASSEFLDGSTGGLWSAIVHHDFDSDGDQDLIVGNLGLNTQFRASPSEPVSLIFDDFDGNGYIDPVVTYFIQRKPYLFATRDELTDQVPSFRKRFTDYHSYSEAGASQVLTPAEVSNADKREVQVLESSYFRNDNGTFKRLSMPVEMQMAPVYAMELIDANSDGITDLVCGGNMSEGRARMGRMNASPGMVFLSDGKGGFRYVYPFQSGININGDVRKIGVSGKMLIFALNDAAPQFFRLSTNSVVP